MVAAIFSSILGRASLRNSLPHKSLEEIQFLNGIFSQIENKPFTYFSSPKQGDSAEEVQKREEIIRNIQATVYQGKSLSAWMELAEKTIQVAKPLLSPREQRDLCLLQEQLLALQYRSGSVLKGTDPRKGQELYQKIYPILCSYVIKPSMNPGRAGLSDPLSTQEKTQLLLACIRYPLLIQEFLKKHSENPQAPDKWISDFIKWSLRSECNVGVFVKMPMERRLLSQAHLDKRSGAVHGKKGIHFHKIPLYGSLAKVLSLHIDGAMRPIQGDYKKEMIPLRNLVNPTHPGFTLSPEQMIDLFRKKTTGYGSVEYLQRGVANWNAIKLSSYNEKTGKDEQLSSENLLEKLHYVAPLLSLSNQAVKERYELSSEEPLQDGQWALVLRASRQKANLNVLEAHSYLEAVHRNGDRYLVFPIGVQPHSLPSNSLQKLFYLTATKKAGLHYPDESCYLSQRQHTAMWLTLTTEEQKRLQTALADRYQAGKEKNLLFQFGGMNCGYHVQSIFDQVVAEPFYEGIRSAIANMSKNPVTHAWTGIQMKRALEGLNHGILHCLIQDLVQHLLQNNDPEGELQRLSDLAVSLMSRIFGKELPQINVRNIRNKGPQAIKHLQEFLFETVETIRFYRLDLFESESDQPILSSVQKVLNKLPWRWAKRLVINLFMLLLGSWRWEVIQKENAILKKNAKNVLTNPLLLEGYLHHPAALWLWKEKTSKSAEKLESHLKELSR